jgi:hypothetical protein
MSVVSFIFIEIFTASSIAVFAITFAVVAAVMYFIFRLLKRSVRMAFRMAMVAAFFVIAAAGAVSIWWFGSGFLEKPSSRPASSRSR